MKILRSLILSTMLLLVAGVFVTSCSDKELDGLAKDDVQHSAEWQAVHDSICGLYIDTTNVAEHRGFYAVSYESDGTTRWYTVHDNDYDQIYESDTIISHWKLFDGSVTTEDGYSFYMLEATLNWAENLTQAAIDTLVAYGVDTIAKDTAVVILTPDKDMYVYSLTSDTTASNFETRAWYNDWDDFKNAFSENIVKPIVQDGAATVSTIVGLGESIWDGMKSCGKTVLRKAESIVDNLKAELTKFLESDAALETAPNYSNWMDKIKDEVPVCKLSIPGTHDTSTFYMVPPYTLWAQTQVFSIEDLWARGCRQFDIRIGWYNNNEFTKFVGITQNLQCIHGSILVPCCLSVREALNKISKLVKDNPSETAIVVTSADDWNDHREEGKEALAKIIDNTDSVVSWKPDITLGEARGHMIIISRDGELATKKHVAYSYSWNTGSTLLFGGDLTPLYVQDVSGMEWNETVNTWLAKKEKAIDEAMEYAADIPYWSDTWIINHTSGFTKLSLMNLVGNIDLPSVEAALGIAGTIMSYSENAYTINPYMNTYIKNHPGQLVGIVPMDFLGSEKTFVGYTTNAKELPVTIMRNNNYMKWQGESIMKPGKKIE